MNYFEKILIVILAMLAGRFYLKYKQEKRRIEVNRQCKRDFLAMYKSVLTDVNTLKNRNDELNSLFNQLKNGDK
jgi:hypothetical protein